MSDKELAPRIDFAGLSEPQREAAGLIAMGQDGFLHPRTLTALESKGIIESYDERLGGWPPLTVKRWSMPIWVHIQWCAYCSEQFRRRSRRVRG